MEFKDIEYVCAIAEYQSITKAAESLFITQPTLSQYIKNMQNRLGIRLFRYEGNQILLTFEGELFVKDGIQLLNARDKLMNTLNSSLKTGRGRLKLAIPLGRGSYLLPAVLPEFHKLYNNVEIELKEGSSKELVTALKDGLCDIVVINKPSFSLNMEYETLGYEKMLLVMSKDSPYTDIVSTDEQGHCFVSMEDCREAPFILHQAYQHTGQIERHIFRNAGFKPNIIVETKNLEASYRLAASNYGLTFLSEYHINRLTKDHETIHCQISDPITNMELIVGYRSHSDLSPLAREFVKTLKRCFLKSFENIT